MPRRAPTLVLLALVAVALRASVAGAQATPLAFAPCADDAHQGCAHLAVPLDRSGAVPGSVTLSLRRVAAAGAPARVAIVPLAGGPGQAALPLTSDFQKLMAPGMATRDLLVFDQRGTGESSPLHCPALDTGGSNSQDVARCASELGRARGSFTTSASVDDLEAVRQAAGYDKLVLFGVSYGTKVALEYAERYPDHVESMILDSIVGVTGPDPFDLSTFAAIPRVLSDLCAAPACAGITPDATGDIARLVARLARSPLRGDVFDGAGRRRRVSLGRGDLLGLIVAGDENPALRAELPAAAHSALAGDAQPLLRLTLLAAGLTPDAMRQELTRQSQGAAFDGPLYVATTCEELLFPWDRAATASVRLSQAISRASALTPTQVAPFDRTTALYDGPIPTCLRWPVASPPPPPDGPLPNVPTLALSGAADVRTPTEDATKVVARIPAAQLIVVPHDGHSVLGTDLSGCAQNAVTAFFAGTSATPCASTQNLFAPTPLPPQRLSSVAPAPNTSGRPGRTLAAVAQTLTDLRREIIGATLSANQTLPVGARFGGLRGGSAVLTHNSVRLRAISYISGVTVSGTIPSALLLTNSGHAVQLRVGGSAAAAGTAVVAGGGRISGKLGGRTVRARTARAAGAFGSGTWPGILPPLPAAKLGRVR